jgi:hypothetical protein
VRERRDFLASAKMRRRGFAAFTVFYFISLVFRTGARLEWNAEGGGVVINGGKYLINT